MSGAGEGDGGEGGTLPGAPALAAVFSTAADIEVIPGPVTEPEPGRDADDTPEGGDRE